MRREASLRKDIEEIEKKQWYIIELKKYFDYILDGYRKKSDSIVPLHAITITEKHKEISDVVIIHAARENNPINSMDIGRFFSRGDISLNPKAKSNAKNFYHALRNEERRLNNEIENKRKEINSLPERTFPHKKAPLQP